MPVTIDFEGGYTDDILQLKENIEKIIAAGAAGINFEDQIVGGAGLYSIDQQVKRIAAIRETAEINDIPLFINARTDIFLKTYPAEHDAGQIAEALARAAAYAEAGASGFFAPRLRNSELIKLLCESTPIPVNIMDSLDAPPNSELSALGVARISYGPAPYRQVIDFLKNAAAEVFAEHN